MDFRTRRMLVLPSRNTVPQSAMIGIDKIFLFVWVEALRSCQQFFQSYRDGATASWVLPVLFGRY